MDNNHGTITLKGNHAKHLANHKVGTKVSMMTHGMIESHEMMPDYESMQEDVGETPKGGKRKEPKKVLHTRVKILRVEPPQAKVATPLDQVMK